MRLSCQSAGAGDDPFSLTERVGDGPGRSVYAIAIAIAPIGAIASVVTTYNRVK